MNLLNDVVHVMRGGGDPMTLFRHWAAKDPRVERAIQMTQGKNTQQLKSMCENMCKERGISLEEALKTLGVR